MSRTWSTSAMEEFGRVANKLDLIESRDEVEKEACTLFDVLCEKHPDAKFVSLTLSEDGVVRKQVCL